MRFMSQIINSTLFMKEGAAVKPRPQGAIWKTTPLPYIPPFSVVP